MCLGNHDPYLKNSYYATYDFGKNVKVFSSTLEKAQFGNINICGYGFEDFYMNPKPLEELKIEDKDKINILLTHADLNGAGNNETRYNPVSRNEFHSLGYDYIALGHIHKREIDKNIVYPGSLVSLGFDELGHHGMIVRRDQRSYKRAFS